MTLLSSGRYQVWLEAAIGALAAIGVVVIAPRPTLDYPAALTFFVAIFLLDLLDLRMPYGDLTPVDSAFVAACLVLWGPTTALISATLARITVHLARDGATKLDELIGLVSRRLVVILLSSLLLGFLRPVGASPLVLSLAIGVAFVSLDLVIAQVQSIVRLHESFLPLLSGNVALQWPLLASQVSVAALTVLIYPGMGSWGLVLMLLLVFLMRQSLALLLEIRQAYRSTIEALVASIEIQNKKRRGHAERVESIARAIGLRLGLKGRSLETLGYAALLHDVDLIGVDSDDRPAAIQADRHAADIISGVKFLSDVLPVLHLCDGSTPADSPSDLQRLSACIVSVASQLDEVHMGDTQEAVVDSMSHLPGDANGTMMRDVVAAALALGYDVGA